MKVNVPVGLYLVKVKATKLSIFLILEEKKCSTVASGEFVRCRRNSVRFIHQYRWIISTCGTQTSLLAKLDSYSFNVNLCETSFCWITFNKHILEFLVTLFSWLNLVSLKKGFCFLKPCIKHSSLRNSRHFATNLDQSYNSLCIPQRLLLSQRYLNVDHGCWWLDFPTQLPHEHFHHFQTMSVPLVDHLQRKNHSVWVKNNVNTPNPGDAALSNI